MKRPVFYRIIQATFWQERLNHQQPRVLYPKRLEYDVVILLPKCFSEHWQSVQLSHAVLTTSVCRRLQSYRAASLIALPVSLKEYMLSSTHPQHFNRGSINCEGIRWLRVCYEVSHAQVTNIHSCYVAYQIFFMLQPISSQRHVDNNKNFMLRHVCCFL
jgi:hypothetical protein